MIEDEIYFFSEKERDRYILVKNAIENYTKKVTTRPEEARNTLVEAGIYEKDGALNKNYKGNLMIVSLLGTCVESTWREELIPLLKINYFNPVVKEWNTEAKENEIKHRKHDDFLLYYITPRMKGWYSIAEVTEDSIKNPKKTIFAYTTKDGEFEFDKQQINSLKEIGNLVKRNGATFIESGTLEDIADHINKNATRFMKHIKGN